jgi:hypothetical protein|tara:strand:- start:316 stop:699 length:384 start_codon:yes stop_codon:yes gene_type:complete
MPTQLVTHTAAEMKGAGKLIGSFPGDTFGPLIMQFNNGDTPAYFTMEQVTGRNEFNFIVTGTSDYAAGSISNLNNLSLNNIIHPNYKLSVAVPPGISSMLFDATIGDGSGQVRLRATGNFDLEIIDP